MPDDKGYRREMTEEAVFKKLQESPSEGYAQAGTHATANSGTPRPLDDELSNLLREAAKGDKQAFAKLYEKTSAKLFGIVRRICTTEETAQEALQESYLLIWRYAASFDPQKAAPITWMSRIARNKAIDIRRLQSERISSLGVELDMEAPGVEIGADILLEKGDSLRRLMTCLQGLAEDRREMILMAYMKGLTREEIGTQFNRPVNTVKTVLRRSLAQLKECIDGGG